MTHPDEQSPRQDEDSGDLDHDDFDYDFDDDFEEETDEEIEEVDAAHEGDFTSPPSGPVPKERSDADPG